ncbi:anti-sigma factor [Kineosporia succinea]|uniref:Regulator of SigK n=1 Tax=Kineosporia succinea TaxID=84632 RepID=A0ABT9P772_9ACTN|nr:anti-sigma factor [Kineosporia succinea]MDP9828538.1 anti-sigma-K factor RskA [Kineosporia succinea]
MPEIHDLHTLTAAYALDALDELERRAFERHLRECEPCRVEVREFGEAAASLADRVAEPAPAGMRDAVLTQVRETRQVSAGSLDGGRAARPGRARRLLAGAAAVLVLVVGVGLGGLAWNEHRSLREAQTLAEGMARVLRDPDRISTAGDVSGGGTVTMVMAGDTAVLSASGVPDAPHGHEYQMWVIRGGSVVSGGRLDLRDGDGSAMMTGLSPDVRLAVSVEPEGGSERPTTTPVVQLSASTLE